MIINLTKKKLYQNIFAKMSGFSIVDMLIVLSIITILASLATPNVKNLMQSYKLRMASTDLISYMNMAKIRSTKQSYPWVFNFNPAGFVGYEIFYTNSRGDNITVAKVNFNSCDGKSNYTTCYNSDINFQSPSLSETCDTSEFRFNPNGLTNVGCVFISNKAHTGYYRIELLAASGIIRTQKWNGKSWE